MKKVLAVMCAAVMLSGCSVPFVPETEIEMPQKYELYRENEVEDPIDCREEFAWYEKFCDDLLQLNSTVVIDEFVKKSDIRAAFVQLKDDCPEIFWLDSYYYYPKSDSVELQFGFIDGIDEDNLPEMFAELEDAADEIIASLPGEDADVYDRILAAHDALIDRCEYDYAGMESGGNGKFATSYGALVEGKAICSGYAEGFGYLMKRMGVEAGVCRGYMAEGFHAWNYVMLNGDYYWIDTTWDDESSRAPSREYFMFNDDIMLRTRSISSEQNYVPKCIPLDNYYLVRDGAYFTEYDLEAVKDYVSGCSGDYCEIMFADYDTYCDAIEHLLGKHEILKVADTKNATYYRDDRMFVIQIDLRK